MLEAAKLSDIPRIVALGREMHAESSYRDQAFDGAKVGRLLAGLIQGAGVVFVARRGDNIIGGLAGGVTQNWFNDDLIGFEYGLFVSQQHRGIIAARALVTAFHSWCWMRGAVRIRMGITTGVHAESTAKFYRKLGMHDAGSFFDMENPNVPRS